MFLVASIVVTLEKDDIFDIFVIIFITIAHSGDFCEK